MNRLFRTSVVALALAACPLAQASAQTVRSAYTDHDYERCRLVPPRDERDGDIVTERRCAGHAGIPVVWVAEPDASTVAFGRNGLTGGLDSRFSFALAGNRIEWRGPETGGRIRPYAAIVRYQLCRSVGGPCQPELVVFRLEGDRRSCLVASVSGSRSDANERARTLADEVARGFRCGVDRARASE